MIHQYTANSSALTGVIFEDLSFYVPLLQEEDEHSYKQHFPDHFNAFADVAELDDMPNLGDDSMVTAAEAEPGLTEAEASSNAAQQLLHGAILSDLVTLHARYTTLPCAWKAILPHIVSLVQSASANLVSIRRRVRCACPSDFMD